jgi:hypothetical protein
VRPKLNTWNADQRYHRCMSETPPTGHPSAPGPAGFPPGFPPTGPWGPPGPVALNRPARWPVLVMLLITLVAVAAAVAAWLRPIPHNNAAATPSAPSYSDDQVADAKAKVCAAFEKVLHATDINAARNGGDDPNTQLIVATAQRQVFVVGSTYLMTTLAEERAASADLTAAARNLARLYQIVTLDLLAGDNTGPDHDELKEAGSKVEELCK